MTRYIISVAPAAYAADYYVATNGNNSNSGTISSPFLTIAKGVSVLIPGKVLCIRGGTYLQTARLSIDNSGTAGSPITIKSYPGETAVISGDLNRNGLSDTTDTPGSPWGSLLRITGDYNLLQDVEVCYSSGRGIQVEGDYNVISGCDVHHVQDIGIYLYGAYNTAEYNTVHRCSEINYGLDGEYNYSGGIELGNINTATPPGSAHHSIVRGNLVYNNSGEGILLENSDYLTVEGNVCYNNWAAQGIDNCQCSYVTLSNNLIYWTGDTFWSKFNDGSSGILLSNEDLGPGYPISHDVDVLNNIVIGCKANIDFWNGSGQQPVSSMVNYQIANNTLVEAAQYGIRLDAPYGGGVHSGNRVANNLVLQQTHTVGNLGTGTGITFDHNQWSRTPTSGFGGTGDVIGAPLLVDSGHALTPGTADADWYKLTSSSPARGVGATDVSDVTDDYFGTARSSPPDMGAHEY